MKYKQKIALEIFDDMQKLNFNNVDLLSKLSEESKSSNSKDPEFIEIVNGFMLLSYFAGQNNWIFDDVYNALKYFDVAQCFLTPDLRINKHAVYIGEQRIDITADKIKEIFCILDKDRLQETHPSFPGSETRHVTKKDILITFVKNYNKIIKKIEVFFKNTSGLKYNRFITVAQ